MPAFARAGLAVDQKQPRSQSGATTKKQPLAERATRSAGVNQNRHAAVPFPCSASIMPMSDAAPRESLPATDPMLSALNDENWRVIAPLLPEPATLGRRRSTDPRKVVAAIEYQWRTCCPWRKLPPEFQPWPTIYGYVAAWRRDGTLRKLRPLLDPKHRERLRRCEEGLPERLNPFRAVRR